MLVGLWLFDNRKIISLTSKTDDENLFVKQIMTIGVGYNDSLFRIGIILTIVFALSYLAYFNKTDNHVILRYGRSRFINYEIKKSLMFAFLFSFQFWIVNELFTLIFVDFNLLVEKKFFACSILYFFTRFAYFMVFSATLLMARILFNYRNYYVYPALAVRLAFNSLPYFMIDEGIILYAGFVNEWINKGTFDYLEYIKNTAVCVIIAILLFLAAKLIFLKKDILTDEKESI